MKAKGIRHDDCVFILEEMSTHARTQRRTLRVGTAGRVLALRDDSDGRKALVKFEGFGWPKQVRIDQIGKEKPDGQ